MPELPEVEVSRQGIEPWLLEQTIEQIKVRTPKLRWPVPDEVKRVEGAKIIRVSRRAKYLLLETTGGTLLIHLGMSGNVRVLHSPPRPGKHDHLDILLGNGSVLRFHDPRRFGAVLWQEGDGLLHPLLAQLGPEPLCDEFDADYLIHCSTRRSISIKQLLMDSKVVVGIGNIYANEALFRARISPRMIACQLTREQAQILVDSIKRTLIEAIGAGGTTLKDFLQADGKPGYFALNLNVYGREGSPVRTASIRSRSLSRDSGQPSAAPGARRHRRVSAAVLHRCLGAGSTLLLYRQK